MSFPGGGEDQILPPETSGHHRPAGDHDGRDVQTGDGHPARGNNFIARSQDNDGIEAIGIHGQFHGIGDKVPAGKDALHSFMALGDAIAEGDGVHLERHAPGHSDAGLRGFGQGPQVHVPGIHFRPGVDYPDKGLFEIAIRKTQGAEQRPVCCPFVSANQQLASSLHFFPRPLFDQEGQRI